MSSENIAVQVRQLSKCYQIYGRPQDRLKQSILPRLRSALGREQGRYFREFWALNDINFTVGRGETIGILGRNGSGKSTLLQIICGTLEPTSGNVETNGRVAALLELGAGFNPEFTGRENVFMNAAILGLSEKEIQDRFDDIAAFADIGEFIEQPVKHYSSGMYARLAFSVAINVDPEILIVDEALAVGDEPFQRKCFARIEKIRQNGGTILFVSHSGSIIINLCDRAILLHEGKQLYTGVPKRAVFFSQKLGNSQAAETRSVIDEINAASADNSDADHSALAEHRSSGNEDNVAGREVKAEKNKSPLDTAEKEFFDKSSISQSVSSYEENGAGIRNPCLLTRNDTSVNHIFRGREYRLQCEVNFERHCPRVRSYALIRTTSGVDLAGCAYPQLGAPGLDIEEDTTLTFEFPFTCSLNPATYFCSFAIQAEDGTLLHRIVDAIAFRVTAENPSSATGIVDVGFNPRAYKTTSA